MVRDEILSFLKSLNIPFETLEHPPAPSIDDCAAISETLRTTVVKNYFLAPRNGKSHYLCLVMPATRLVTSELSKQIGSPRLMFAPEKDLALLNTLPGSVSPLGLLFDTACAVKLLIDSRLLTLDTVAFHPCDNTMTVKMAVSDFLRVFLPAVGHEYVTVEFNMS